MSYSSVLGAIDTVLAAVSGVAYTLKYEPRSIQAAPMIYSVLDGVDVDHESGMGETPAYRYRIRHRMLFLWQETEQAELALIPYVNALPEAIHTNRSLGGILNGGICFLTNMEAGYEDVNGVTYRVLDCYTETLEQPA